MPKRTVSRNPRGDIESFRAHFDTTLLVDAIRQGGVTLVLGAGVSIPRGIPKWDKLAKAVWHRVFPSEPSPWTRASRGQSPKTMPQFLPIIFELAYRKLGEAKFIQVLQKCLYARARYPAQDRGFAKSKESLAVLARVIVKEHNRLQGRRIDAVITFNADDLIEQAVGVIQTSKQNSAVLPVTRSTH